MILPVCKKTVTKTQERLPLKAQVHLKSKVLCMQQVSEEQKITVLQILSSKAAQLTPTQAIIGAERESAADKMVMAQILLSTEVR